MKLVMIPYGALPCSLKVFTINGQDADKTDFGSQKDTGREYAEDYACGNNEFIPYEVPDIRVLERYNITREEYDEICQELCTVCHVGTCGWCV